MLRFPGRQAQTVNDGGFVGAVVSDRKERPEGIRRKHRVHRNAVKRYDQQGSVLRVETTLNNVSDRKGYRPKDGDEDGAKDGRPLRTGVADRHRQAAVSQKANERYLEALAATRPPVPWHEVTAERCRPVRWHRERARGWNPLGADRALLTAVADGAFVVNGFRNREVRQRWYGEPTSNALEQKRRAAAVTRQLRLLRAQGLMRKVAKTQR